MINHKLVILLGNIVIRNRRKEGVQIIRGEVKNYLDLFMSKFVEFQAIWVTNYFLTWENFFSSFKNVSDQACGASPSLYIVA